MVILCCIYRVVLDIKDENERLKRMYANVEENVYVNIDNYYIYGTHLNMEGYILKSELDNFKVEKARILIRDTEGTFNECMAILNDEDDRYNFGISSNINEGIDLETLKSENNYAVFAKLSGTDEKGKYTEKLYSLKNISDVKENEYYTLTKNGKNNKVDIVFNENVKSLELKSRECELPENVYDMVEQIRVHSI